jgi:hypothetical protein
MTRSVLPFAASGTLVWQVSIHPTKAPPASSSPSMQGSGRFVEAEGG